MGYRYLFLLIPFFVACQKSPSTISMEGGNGRMSAESGQAAAILGSQLSGAATTTPQFGGNVDPDNFGGQTNPEANAKTSSAEQSASAVDSKAGLQAYVERMRRELRGMDPELFDILYESAPGPGMNQWYCAYHDRRFGPLSGAFGLVDVDPAFPGGYRLSMKPSIRHCTGIAMRVTLIGAFYGRAVELTCTGNNLGTCSRGLFHVPLRSSPSWPVSQADLSPLARRQPVAVFYDWDHNTQGSCSGSDKASYGIAILLQRAGYTAPAEVACPAF